jgi:rubrerythrin
MLSKLDAFGSFSGGPTREQIEHIRDEEHQHFTMLRELIERLDGDPTAITPSANVQAVASMGLPQVLTDPRTSLVQSLEAVLVAELADNACWPALIELLTNGGHDGEAQRFFSAVESEREHLQCVRMWLAAAHGRSVEDAQRLSDAETAALLAAPAIATIAPASDEDETAVEATASRGARTRDGRGRTTGEGGTEAGTGRRGQARKRVTAKARGGGAKARAKTNAARRRKAR